ncbi:MAG: BMP family ABC transporter substrate-binding protein [Firmicutes bacterium]|nr:BMP family ABC transporter substrate-binding protein [Bacillota bacterium]
MKRRNFIMIIIVVFSMLLATGCELIQTQDEGPIEVGLLLMSSPDDMYSEGYYGYYALKALETKYGVEIAYNENVSSVDNAGYLLNSYGKKDFDLVIAVGNMFQAPILDVAPSYINTKFVCIGGDVTEDNVIACSLPVNEIGNIMGLVSAGYNENKANSIAYVQVAEGNSYYEGFLDGVKSISSQTPVKEFIFSSEDTYSGLIEKFEGNSIGLASIMFYSPNLEKSLTAQKYLFDTLGGAENETDVPRVVINYNAIFDLVYQNYLNNSDSGKNIEVSLDDNILKVHGIELLDSIVVTKIQSLLP